MAGGDTPNEAKEKPKLSKTLAIGAARIRKKRAEKLSETDEESEEQPKLSETLAIGAARVLKKRAKKLSETNEEPKEQPTLSDFPIIGATSLLRKPRVVWDVRDASPKLHGVSFSNNKLTVADDDTTEEW